jgi:hypothetical protein
MRAVRTTAAQHRDTYGNCKGSLVRDPSNSASAVVCKFPSHLSNGLAAYFLLGTLARNEQQLKRSSVVKSDRLRLIAVIEVLRFELSLARLAPPPNAGDRWFLLIVARRSRSSSTNSIVQRCLSLERLFFRRVQPTSSSSQQVLPRPANWPAPLEAQLLHPCPPRSSDSDNKLE